MKQLYKAVTYDVCEHNHLYEDMNEYFFDSFEDMEKQIKEIAKLDIAPLIKVYESDTSDFKQIRLYKEYRFEVYDCGCTR
ncbi:hypothetical protein H1D32_20840 [Anaerobacillus sp. CMMVII]|uniref:hypothetical protein n=1 Tax=Anaerobacillus sp. CMMVII TaxID=2755588 RepID=UPI0021B73297|nr:hypothetical protein [Anaerobacillus sp. CMMVII]MCT8139928.1 hypothetical protein [Anaerobacillus sp. CMMVII]